MYTCLHSLDNRCCQTKYLPIYSPNFMSTKCTTYTVWCVMSLFVSLWCIGLLLWYTDMSLWCTGVSLWCTGVSLWCTGMSLWCTGVSLWCTGVSLWCTGVSLWCTGVSLWCTGMSHTHCDVQEEQPHISYGLIVEIDRHKETKKVTLKSPVTVRVTLHHWRSVNHSCLGKKSFECIMWSLCQRESKS